MNSLRASLVFFLSLWCACHSAVTQDPQKEIESGVGMEVGYLRVEPLKVDFGDQCAGLSAEEEVLIKNSGSADINIASVGLSDGSSGDFQVVDPDAALGWLSSGQSRTLKIRYTPSGGDNDAAELEVRTFQGFAGERVQLSGAEGGPSLQTSPLSLDLGAVAVGSSASAQVLLRSAGTATLSIYEVAIESFVEGLRLGATAALGGPKNLPSGDTLALDVHLRPEAFQPYSGSPIGQLVVSSSDCQDSETSVPIYGWPGGIDRPCMGEVEEDFEGREAIATDVLFVIDNSDSMQGEQDALAAGFSDFIALADALQLDYRIGVITTDINAQGLLVGDVITPSSSVEFAANAKVGIGGPDEEEGLASAALSLSQPSAFGGVLRPDAFLVLVFVSDEDDQSPEPIDAYLEAYSEALSGDAARLMVHAIVGPEGGCDSAVSGTRYRELVELLGGITSDICDADFGAGLEAIGRQSFGYKTTFALLHAAEATSVVVTLEGEECASGWTLSSDGRSLVFDPEGQCLPELGQSLSVRYSPICWDL